MNTIPCLLQAPPSTVIQSAAKRSQGTRPRRLQGGFIGIPKEAKPSPLDDLVGQLVDRIAGPRKMRS
jgi:hypothetical protein